MQVAQNVGSTLRPTPEMVEIIENVKKFREALETIRDFGEKMKKYAGSFGTIDGRSAFKLYDTYGFPIELTMEMAHEKGLEVDEKGFEERFRQHQATSHAGAEQRFKGGLADNTEETAKLHTATHLLHAALRKVLGNEVAQKGSNITAERLRFDFSFGRKMTPEELAEVERLVNEAIEANVPVTCEEMTVDEAKAQGAIGLFTSKYGERVKVYTMGNFSKEICGGPHASNTGDLKSFKIKKEESSSAGVRRIKAVIGSKERRSRALPQAGRGDAARFQRPDADERCAISSALSTPARSKGNLRKCPSGVAVAPFMSLRGKTRIRRLRMRAFRAGAAKPCVESRLRRGFPARLPAAEAARAVLQATCLPGRRARRLCAARRRFLHRPGIDGPADARPACMGGKSNAEVFRNEPCGTDAARRLRMRLRQASRR